MFEPWLSGLGIFSSFVDFLHPRAEPPYQARAHS